MAATAVASVNSYSGVTAVNTSNLECFTGLGDELNPTRSSWFGYLFRDYNMETSA
jgi:hypothetical protein